ncbi:MAG: hypothetical protein QM811_08025 [Pirellulales bacterium]
MLTHGRSQARRREPAWRARLRLAAWWPFHPTWYALESLLVELESAAPPQCAEALRRFESRRRGRWQPAAWVAALCAAVGLSAWTLLPNHEANEADLRAKLATEKRLRAEELSSFDAERRYWDDERRRYAAESNGFVKPPPIRTPLTKEQVVEQAMTIWKDRVVEESTNKPIVVADLRTDPPADPAVNALMKSWCERRTILLDRRHGTYWLKHIGNRNHDVKTAWKRWLEGPGDTNAFDACEKQFLGTDRAYETWMDMAKRYELTFEELQSRFAAQPEPSRTILLEWLNELERTRSVTLKLLPTSEASFDVDGVDFYLADDHTRWSASDDDALRTTFDCARRTRRNEFRAVLRQSVRHVVHAGDRLETLEISGVEHAARALALRRAGRL